MAATIPSPQGPRLATAPLPGAYRDTVDVSANARQAGAGLDQVAQVADRIATDQAQTEAWKAQADINKSFMAFDAEARKNSGGTKAAGYSAKVTEWWDKAAQDYGQQMSPMAKTIVSKNLATAKNQAIGAAFDFERVEGKRAKIEALDGMLSGEVSRGSQSPAAAAASTAIITDALQAHGAAEGSDPKFVDKQILHYTTGMHTNVINGLQVTDPKQAQEYFNLHKTEIDGARHDEISRSLNVARAGLEGDQGAQKIWQKAGIIPGKAVELDALEDQAREMFPGDKARQDAALAGLRQRTQAFEHAEGKRATANTNTIMDAIQNRMPFGQVKALPAWGLLPGSVRQTIEVGQEQLAAARESRAAAAESRQATREGRVLTQMRLSEELTFRGNADAYVQYSKPEVLAAMSPEEISALRPFFGPTHIQHLLDKRETLQTKEGKLKATIDTQDFNYFAQKLGLRPNEPHKSEAQKNELATAQMRAESLVMAAERAKRGPLTREETQAILKNELQRTAQVSTWGGLSSEAVPVIKLTEDQMANVEMTHDEIKRTRALMAARYKEAQTAEDKARYGDTPANVKRVWLGNPVLSARLRGARPEDQLGGR